MRTSTGDLSAMSSYDLFRWAEELFADKDFLGAAEMVEDLLAREPDMTGSGAARLLLARAYYHSARLEPALATARVLLDDEPDNGYAALLVARTLQRLSRHEEADRALRLAEALGQQA